MSILISEFFEKGGPGGHGYNRKDIAVLMGVSVMTIGRMIDDNRPISITLRKNKVTGISEKTPEKVWYLEES